MNTTVQGILTVAARTMLALIFLMSALGNKIPNFSGVAQYMAGEGVPAPQVLLAGAIAFLIVGSASLIVGYQARVGAALLFVFLVLATYYFHDFWTFEDAAARQQQTIQFMKNLGLMGAMLFIIANGPGPWSLDERRSLVPATA
jgi:putative oxidoreductase